MKKIYITGPYSDDDPKYVEQNVRTAVEAADCIRMLGYIPFIPHLYHFWHKQIPHDYEFWMDLDHEWLSECDALVYLDGESEGTQEDISLAVAWHIEVYSFKEFIAQKVTASS